MIPYYPKFSRIHIELQKELRTFFKTLKDGISEFTFANLYLFRETHKYQMAMLKDGNLLIRGDDRGTPFFMIPGSLPEKESIDRLFREFMSMKCVSESQASVLKKMRYHVSEDRDNFDYLYLREDLVKLAGARLHKKKNLINVFRRSYSYEGRPLTKKYIGSAMEILGEWKKERGAGDYAASKEALERMEELELCGSIYYVNRKPAAYVLGEELPGRGTFVIHFEKAVGGYRGLYQFVNQNFASLLPEKYKYINREQDLGDEGLRQAKMTYRPVGFIKKYRATSDAGILKKSCF